MAYDVLSLECICKCACPFLFSPFYVPPLSKSLHEWRLSSKHFYSHQSPCKYESNIRCSPHVYNIRLIHVPHRCSSRNAIILFQNRLFHWSVTAEGAGPAEPAGCCVSCDADCVFPSQGILLCPQTLAQARRERLRRAFTDATSDTVSYVKTVGVVAIPFYVCRSAG